MHSNFSIPKVRFSCPMIHEWQLYSLITCYNNRFMNISSFSRLIKDIFLDQRAEPDTGKACPPRFFTHDIMLLHRFSLSPSLMSNISPSLCIRVAINNHLLTQELFTPTRDFHESTAVSDDTWWFTNRLGLFNNARG